MQGLREKGVTSGIHSPRSCGARARYPKSGSALGAAPNPPAPQFLSAQFSSFLFPTHTPPILLRSMVYISAATLYTKTNRHILQHSKHLTQKELLQVIENRRPHLCTSPRNSPAPPATRFALSLSSQALHTKAE